MLDQCITVSEIREYIKGLAETLEKREISCVS